MSAPSAIPPATRWRKLILLWPVLAAWPLWVVWRGPQSVHSNYAPYRFGSYEYTRRFSPQAESLSRALMGQSPGPAFLKPCIQQQKVRTACQPAVFSYLLCWQGDPKPLRDMLHFFRQHETETRELKRACRRWPLPSSLQNGAKNQDDLWRSFCQKAAKS